MDNKRRNELILISQNIHDHANRLLREYLEKNYAQSGPESMEDQLEDWLFLMEEYLRRTRALWRGAALPEDRKEGPRRG